MSDDHSDLSDDEERRRVPAGQALVAVVVALAVGTLLNAEGMAHTAATEPFGWERDLTMKVMDPIVDLSRATGLNQPRKVLSEQVGTAEGPPPEDTSTVVTAPPLDATTTLPPGATTTTTAPPSYRTPTPAEPLRVHVAGDSLVIPIGAALVDRFDGQPVEVTEGYKAATGLARPDVLNWPAKLREDLARLDPDVVVVGFGGNDAQPMEGPDGPLSLGTPEWAAEYQRRVVQILDAVEAEGRSLYWLELPATTAGNIQRAAPVMRAAVEAEAAVRPWAHLIDTNAVLAPDGAFTAYLPDGSGGEVKVRDDDGVHLTTAGAARVVVPLGELIARERKLT